MGHENICRDKQVSVFFFVMLHATMLKRVEYLDKS